MWPETGRIKSINIAILVSWNQPTLTYAKQREVSVGVEFAAETVQVTALFGKPWITVVVIL